MASSSYLALDPVPGFTFGCDPELFIFDTNRQKYVSPEGLIPGDKNNPYKVTKGAVQRDGMAAEFNTDPANSFEEFNDNVASVLRSLKGFLPRHMELHPVSAEVFDEDVWDETPDEAKMLGCSPDFNAWTGRVNPPPLDLDNPRLRTASGHLHVGWRSNSSDIDKRHIINCQDLVKQFDWYLGAWSLDQDTDATRRRLYGNAGACRYKNYGVEYRVLSNFWVTKKTTRRMVWNRMQSAIRNMRDGFLPEDDHVVAHKFNDLLVHSINSSQTNPRLSQEMYFPIRTLGE